MLHTEGGASSRNHILHGELGGLKLGQSEVIAELQYGQSWMGDAEMSEGRSNQAILQAADTYGFTLDDEAVERYATELTATVEALDTLEAPDPTDEPVRNRHDDGNERDHD